MLYAKAVMEVAFSAHAEVVPHHILCNQPHTSILRARGGSSMIKAFSPILDQYSPRTRR